MGHMFHADPKDLAALVTAYADAGPDPVGDHARRGALFFSDHLEDLACLVADGAGNLAADFRPAVLADLATVVGWAKADTEGTDPRWTPGLADTILEAIDAAARRHGLAQPAREASWVAEPLLAWSGVQEEPYDAFLAFGTYAARSHDLDCAALGMDGACQVKVVSDATMHGVPVRLTVSERPDMGAATVREGWARDGMPAVRFVSDDAGCRFELNVATLDGFVLLDAVAGGVFPFPEELQSVRLSIEEAWFHRNALWTLRDLLAEAADAGDADAGRVCALLESDPGTHWKATHRAWALAVRLAGLRPDPRTGSVAGWSAKGPEIARHFTDELVMATVLEPLREPRRAA